MLLALVLPVTVAACVASFPDKTGSVALRFAPGDAAACSLAGIATVRGTLVDAVGFAGSRQQADCASGALVFREVLTGPYTLTLEGLDAGGAVLREVQTDFVLRAEDKDLGVVELGGRPAPGTGDVSFGWRFAGAGCGDAGVASVAVAIEEPTGFVEFQRVLGCTPPHALVTDFAPGPWVLKLAGLDNDGLIRFEATRDFTIEGGGADLGVVDLSTSANPRPYTGRL